MPNVNDATVVNTTASKTKDVEIIIHKDQYDYLVKRVSDLEKQLKITEQDRDAAKTGGVCLASTLVDIVKNPQMTREEIIKALHGAVKQALEAYTTK